MQKIEGFVVFMKARLLARACSSISLAWESCRSPQLYVKRDVIGHGSCALFEWLECFETYDTYCLFTEINLAIWI